MDIVLRLGAAAGRGWRGGMVCMVGGDISKGIGDVVLFLWLLVVVVVGIGIIAWMSQ